MRLDEESRMIEKQASPGRLELESRDEPRVSYKVGLFVRRKTRVPERKTSADPLSIVSFASFCLSHGYRERSNLSHSECVSTERAEE